MLLTSSVGCAREGDVGTEVRVVAPIAQRRCQSDRLYNNRDFARGSGPPKLALVHKNLLPKIPLCCGGIFCSDRTHSHIIARFGMKIELSLPF